MTGYDAIVVGGGIVGLSTAYHLVCDGARTLLVDRGDAGRATDAGAGILPAATNDADDPDPVERFAARAAAYYPELIRRLEADGAGETGYAACGSLIVAANEDEAAAFEEVRAGLFGRPAARRAAAEAGFSEVPPERARELFPPLGRVLGAIHAARGARVDGRLLAAALRRAAMGRGLEVREGGVTGLIGRDGAVRGASLGAEEIAAGSVVIAAGAWSGSFGGQLGVRIPIEPQRGQIVHLDLNGADTGGWPIVSAFRGHDYMVAWPDGRVAVGATRETGSGFRARSTVAGVMRVLAEAVRVAPGLADAAIREVRVGLRPLTPDGLPVLGPVPGVANVLLAAGHGAIGLQLGPYSGRVIARTVARGDPATDLSPFRVDRFP